MQTETSNVTSTPFLKWAGGKRWLVESDVQFAPDCFERYIEPFVGGGAVFFSIPRSNFLISDSNPELINCYQTIKKDWQSVVKSLRLHQANHSDSYYYDVRSSKPRKPHTRAARFIYLNRTCWNGLYRVNLKGQFNVPRGTKDTVMMETDDFDAISKLLDGGSIVCQDFQKTLSKAGEGDFVFVDPPYTVKHNNNGFVKYNEKIFSWQDQELLKQSINQAVSRGAKVTMTNADHPSIRTLYKDNTEIEILDRLSVISGSPTFRGKVSEVLIRFGWSI